MCLEVVIQSQECLANLGIKHLRNGTALNVFVVLSAAPENFPMADFFSKGCSALTAEYFLIKWGSIFGA